MFKSHPLTGWDILLGLRVNILVWRVTFSAEKLTIWPPIERLRIPPLRWNFKLAFRTKMLTFWPQRKSLSSTSVTRTLTADHLIEEVLATFPLALQNASGNLFWNWFHFWRSFNRVSSKSENMSIYFSQNFSFTNIIVFANIFYI